jgi:hypothetical protein
VEIGEGDPLVGLGTTLRKFYRDPKLPKVARTLRKGPKDVAIARWRVRRELVVRDKAM